MTIRSIFKRFLQKLPGKSKKNSNHSVEVIQDSADKKTTAILSPSSEIKNVVALPSDQARQTLVISSPVPAAEYQEREYRQGLEYYHQNDLHNAVKHFERAYEHPKALYRMAKFYENGIPNILNADASKALLLYGAAAKKGNDKAKYCIGKLHHRGSIGLQANIIEAIKWYRDAGSYPKAQCRLGAIYLYGEGIKEKDIALALRYYSKAAENGNVEAQLKLANLYIRGKEGIPQKPFLAKILYQEVERSRHEKYAAEAQLALGNLYQAGATGFPKDLEKARFYYSKAIKYQQTAAYTCFAETVLIKDFNVHNNAIEAYPHLEDAIASSEFNELYAKSLLGLFNQLGWQLDSTLTADQRAEAALEWHLKATEGNRNSFSNLCLGLLYAEGDIATDGDSMAIAENYFYKCVKAIDTYDNPHSQDGHSSYILNFTDTINYLEALVVRLPEEGNNSHMKKTIFTFLAILYERGLINTEIDIKKSLHYYQLADHLGGIYAHKKLVSVAGLTESEARFQLLQAQTSRTNHYQYSLREKLRKEKKENRAQQYQLDHLQNTLQEKFDVLRNKRDEIDVEARQFVSSSKNLALFHQVIRSRLEAIFISVISAAGGFTKIEDGSIASVNTVIELFGDIISAVPITAPFGPLIKWGINKPLDAIDKAREKNKVTNVSDKLTVAEAQKYAANFALELTKRFANQINMLATPDQEESLLANILNYPRRVVQHGKDKIKNITVKSRHLAPAEKLAAFALVWCLDNLLTFPDQKNADKSSLDQYLLEKIEDVPSNDVKSFWDKISDIFHSKKTLLGSNGQWLEPLDLYTRPGVETPCGYRCIDNSSLPEQFGWRKGTIVEVERKHMRYVEQINPLKPTIYSNANYNQSVLFKNGKKVERAPAGDNNSQCAIVLPISVSAPSR